MAWYTQKQEIYFKNKLENNLFGNLNQKLTGNLNQNLSGKIIVELNAPNNTTGATSIIGIKDYLDNSFIYQVYYAEGVILSIIILAIGIYKIIKE